MSKRLYVGNLPYTVASADLEQLFAQFGTVNSVEVMMDRDTGRSKGFAFVEMASENEGRAAIEALNGRNYAGRPLTVNEARPREESRGGRREGGGRYRGW